MALTTQEEEDTEGQEDTMARAKLEKQENVNRKRIMKKLERIKLQRSLSHCRFSPGHDVRAVYEAKIRKLKKNNRDLAKALTDQKIETHQWYSEVVSLKAELQDAQEKLLVHADDNFNNIVQHEVQKQLKELCQPLNVAISSAIENVVEGVENLTKAKQLAASFTKNASRSLRSSSSANSLPRTSGSRLPLAPGSSNSSPQNVVLPMVSGHVLQPARVPIQKLNIAWENKRRERIQAREDREQLDMSVIGEQSSFMESDTESNAVQVSQNDTDDGSSTSIMEEDNNPSLRVVEQRSPRSRTVRQRKQGRGAARRGGSWAGRSSMSPSTPPTPIPSVSSLPVSSPHVPSLTVSSSPTSSPAVPSSPVPSPPAPSSPVPSPPAPSPPLPHSPTTSSPPPSLSALSLLPTSAPASSPPLSEHTPSLSSPSKLSPALSLPAPSSSPAPSPPKVGVKYQSPAKSASSDEDPLEGPSWWYCGGNRGRGRGRGRARVRGRGRGRSRSKGRGGASNPHNTSASWHLNVVATPDSSSESEEDNANFKSPVVKTTKKAKKVQPVKKARSPPIDLDRSYLDSPATMLARLEELEAKRGGRRSRTRSKGRSTRPSSECSRPSEGLLDNHHKKTQQGRKSRRDIEIIDLDDGSTNSATLKMDDRHETVKTPQLSCEIPTVSPENQPIPSKYADFLITDNDLTCINNTSMDITQPVSSLITHISDELQQQQKIIDQFELELRTETQIEKRKFFKSQVTPQINEITKTNESTPFDLSLLDASVVTIQSYSSQRTTEKENLPPHVNKSGSEDESSCLRPVSIVLQDCMRSAQTIKKESTAVSVSPSSESKKSNGRKRGSPPKKRQDHSESPLVKKPVKRKNLTYSTGTQIIDSEDDMEEEENMDVSYIPSGTRRSKTASSDKISGSFKKESQKRKSDKKTSMEGKSSGAVKKSGRKSSNKITKRSYISSSSDLCLSNGHNDDNKHQKKMLKNCYVKISPADVTPSTDSPLTHSPAKCNNYGIMVDESPESRQEFVSQMNLNIESVTNNKQSEEDSPLLKSKGNTSESNNMLSEEQEGGAHKEKVAENIDEDIVNEDLMRPLKEVELEEPEDVETEVQIVKQPGEEFTNINESKEDKESVNFIKQFSGKHTEKQMGSNKRKTIPDCSEKTVCEMDSDDVTEHCETGQRRKRRAAAQVTYKQIGLNRKMRKSKDNQIIIATPGKEKRGRRSCTD